MSTFHPQTHAPVRPPLAVAFLARNGGAGGAELLLAETLRVLDRGRCAPLLICGAEGELPRRARALGIPVALADLGRQCALPLWPRRRLHAPHPGTLLGLAALLRRARVDLIHSWTLETRNLGHLLGPLLRRPVVQGCQDLYYGPEFGALQWWLLNHLPARVLATSHAVARSLRAGEALAPGRVAIIRPGIDCARSPLPGAGARAALRASLGIPDAAPVAGLVGRYCHVKGHDVFLEAMAELARTFPRLAVVLVGAAVLPGDDREREIERRIHAAGLAGRVIRTGFRADAATLIGALDVLVCASTQESFGLTLVEAGAAGVPVVATRCGGPEEIVVDQVTGLLVPVGDSAALAAAVARLLADPAKARAMGRAAAWHVRRHFDLRPMVARLTDLYQSVARGERAGMRADLEAGADKDLPPAGAGIEPGSPLPAPTP